MTFKVQVTILIIFIKPLIYISHTYIEGIMTVIIQLCQLRPDGRSVTTVLIHV